MFICSFALFGLSAPLIKSKHCSKIHAGQPTLLFSHGIFKLWNAEFGIGQYTWTQGEQWCACKKAKRGPKAFSPLRGIECLAQRHNCRYNCGFELGNSLVGARDLFHWAMHGNSLWGGVWVLFVCLFVCLFVWLSFFSPFFFHFCYTVCGSSMLFLQLLNCFKCGDKKISQLFDLLQINET